MALVFTDVKRIFIPGWWREGIVDITFDNAYPALGWPITPANLKFDNLTLSVVVMGMDLPGAFGVSFLWDQVNSKLLAFKGNGVALFQQIAAADLSAKVARCLVIGY